MGEGHVDIGQLKHKLPRQEKLDLEHTVSHMYDLPQSRRRCGRSCSSYPGTWSPISSRWFARCGTPGIDCRSRQGGSLVGRLPNGVACRPVSHRTSAPPTSATPHDLHTDSTDRPPVKKNNAFSSVRCRRQILQWRTNKHYFLQQPPSTEPSNTLNPNISLPKALDVKGTLG